MPITPEELYNRHTESFPNDKCVTMFGFKPDQILYALKQTYDKKKTNQADIDYLLYANNPKPQEKSQMTREEAIKKIYDVTYGAYGEKFIACLEALGLLKFEEEKPKFTPVYLIGGDAVSRLDQHGYKIVRKE